MIIQIFNFSTIHGVERSAVILTFTNIEDGQLKYIYPESNIPYIRIELMPGIKFEININTEIICI